MFPFLQLAAELKPVAHSLEHRGDADEVIILAPQGRQGARPHSFGCTKSLAGLARGVKLANP